MEIALAIAIHIALLVEVLVGIWFVHWMLRQLWHKDEPKVADLFPFRYIIEVVDASVLVLFGGLLIYRIIQIVKGR